MPSNDTGRRLQRAAIAVAVILAIAFAAEFLIRLHARHLLAKESQASARAVPAVDVVVVRDNTGTGTLTLPGETAAWYESTIYARVDGYVAKWYVDIGDHVKAGQLMATIDTPELDAELMAAKAKLQAAQAQVKVSEATAEFASTTYARWRDSPKGVVSEQEREDKKAGNDAAAAQLQAARAQVSLDEADVNRLSAFEQFKRVTAPFDGTVIERRIDIGNLVTAGSSGNTTSLYRVSQDDPIRVFVDVPQSAAPNLMKVGVAAQISISDSGAPPIAGKITRTSEAVNPQARTFRAELDIPNPKRALVPGLYVQVAFQLNNSGMYQVPAASLTFTPSGPKVAVVNPDNQVQFHPVTIGRDDGDHVELSSGVASGDRLVLNISNQIADGQRVRITDTPGSPTDTEEGSSVAMAAH
ncbi:MAG TPA: efflux RND transporter periplasmic adaptor subunit [Steroidobacteraceae bacterium]|nr:efflux RND transporter periplasmic adaptor subunit [Steroidobacteraceae bacterium]